ncbi:MAG: LptF/LptG family permease [Alphaproteobacteria bacterium]|nr:LptF/LptG family permease [Alphaproteobacteria bacterium]
MNRVLFSYILKKQLKTIIFVSVSVFFLILLFDFAEVSRKFSITNFSEILYALKLSFLRTPITFCEIIKYVYFITATFSLWDLCRSQQITILKSIGRSPKQILIPFISFSIFIGMFWLFVFHPIGIKSENMYNRAVEDKNSASIEKNSDIWIDFGKDKYVVFIKTIDKNKLSGFYLFDLKKNERLVAKSGEIDSNIVTLKNATLLKDNNFQHSESIKIFDNISSELIELLSLPPHRHNIYSLYKVYKIQKRDKVNLRLYELALQKLLANCATFILFALIAAVICFPINRYKSKTNIAIKVIFSVLFLRFSNSLLESMAYAGVISVVLSSWAVVLILIFLSIAVLVWKEA